MTDVDISSRGAREPPALFLIVATATQAVGALFSLPEPVKTLVFLTILLTTTLTVWRYAEQVPQWFVLGIVSSIILFLATTPAGSAWLAQMKDLDLTSHSASSNQRNTSHYIRINVFLDENGDGRNTYPDEPIPNIPIRVTDGRPRGMFKILNSFKGSTNVEEVVSSGRISVIVCGISNSHEIGTNHTSERDFLDLEVGISKDSLDTCRRNIDEDAKNAH